MNKKPLLMLGVASAVVIIGGIILAVLLYQTVVTIGDGYAKNITETNWESSIDMISERIWLSALVYIIPGILGCVAAFLQNKCMYVITCIFTILSLLIMALFAFIAGLTLIVLILSVGSISEFCKDDDICKCRSPKEAYEDKYQDTPFKTCAYFEKFNAVITALLVFIVLAWVAELMEFIFSCYFSCRTKRTTGGVILSSQQPMLLAAENQDYPLPSKV